MIVQFDPWKGKLCTCPKKYSLNPYTGCEHRCIYCYITSYIPRGFECRAKKNLLREVKRSKNILNPNFVISMSNSSDPYTPMERVHRLTRACLKILKDFRILIVTKSDLVTRDIDLLREMKASVSMSITTLDRELASKLEPFAPSPEKRLKALENLVNSGIPVSCRIDPIIPGLNEDAEELVENLSDIGVSHVISSTFKPRRDSWERFRKVFKEKARMLQDLYFKKGQKVGNSFYLPKEIRFKLMEKIRRLSISKGMTFGACREGFANKGNCDGSWLI